MTHTQEQIQIRPFVYHEVRKYTIDDYEPITTDDNICIEDDEPIFAPKQFYLPSNVMANVMSYLPTPLDHHKKKMKIVNEDFEIIRDRGEYCDWFEKWSLRSSKHKYSDTLMNLWTKWINDKRRSLEREKELIIIKPKLDMIIKKWKTKKNIINNLQSRGIEIDWGMKREKKDEMIKQIKTHLRAVFKCPYLERNIIRKPIEDFLYSL